MYLNGRGGERCEDEIGLFKNIKELDKEIPRFPTPKGNLNSDSNPNSDEEGIKGEKKIIIVVNSLLRNHRILDKLNSLFLSPQMIELYSILQ
jgi:hypothetical protein